MKFTFIIILLLWMGQLSAQVPALRHFGVEDGLPSSNIYEAFEDSKGYIWFCTDKGITRFDGYSFELFDMEGISSSSDIWGITEDKQGRLWFSTFNNLVYFENNTFHSIPISIDSPKNMVQRHFFDDKNNHFIEFVNGLGIYQVNDLDSLSLSFIQFPTRVGVHTVYFLKEDSEGRLWFSRHARNGLEIFFKTDDKLSLFTKINEQDADFLNYSPIVLEDSTYAFLSKDKSFFFDFETLKSEPLTSLLQEEDIELLPKSCSIDGQYFYLWTNKGLRVVDKTWKKQANYDFLNAFSDHRILEDSKSNIWIYTQNDGVYMLPNMSRGSMHLTFSDHNLDNAIKVMAMDQHQQLWMGTASGKIIVLDKNNKFRHFDIQAQGEKRYSQKLKSSIMGLSFDEKGNLYLGYQKGALLVIPEGLLKQDFIYIKNWTEIKQAKEEEFQLSIQPYAIDNLAAVKSMTNSDENQIMIATSSGIYSFVFKGENIHFERVTNKRTYASAIFQGQLWGGNKRGVFRYNLNKSNKKYNEEASVFQDPVNEITVSQDQKLWIATDGNGLFRYDGVQIDTIAELQGKREIIKSLFIDKDNGLWVTTNKGIVKIEIRSEAPFRYEFRRLCKAYGLATEEVNQVYVKDELIYAATLKGLTILEESSMNRKNGASPLYFTNVSSNHIKKTLQSEYVFPYDGNNLLIEYLCLSYESLADIPYEYWMEGIDKSWQSTTAIQKEYSALNPGKYVFRLRAKDFDGNWSSEKRIKITINPPWWKSPMAYLSYLLLMVLAGYSFYNYQFKKYLKKQELQRNKEMHELKSRFYTNITHEFRTPLTIILGFTKRLKVSLSSEHAHTLGVMERHGTRLLHLINQLLDLNKIEAGAMPISWQHADIVPYLNYMVGLFESAAADKNINLIFYKEIEHLNMDFDADKIQTIFYNLLSNAIKFTSSGGEIIVHVAQNEVDRQLVLKVKDNGVGIRSEVLAFIFHRFYQDGQNSLQNQGTGIGLALAKELVEQMGGTIEVESQESGTMFTVHLPVSETAEIADKMLKKERLEEEIEAFFPKETSSTMTGLELVNTSELPVLLIVEDNIDLSNYLQTLVKDSYQIVVAKDGAEGIEKAFELTPDLIISDIMMPNKNGLELCAILKKDERTSHIPIVLLTGKSCPETKLTGLEYGADAYLVKPFEEKELLIRLKKLNELRQKLQKRYANFALSSSLQVVDNTAEESTTEDVFLQKARAIIEENIDNADLDVNKLCQLLVMSRSQLHKKITALTGKSTTHFIRNIRLQKAKELLQSTDHSIAEIAFQTGFEAQYFSTVFSRTFGMSPTSFRKQ